MVPQKTHHILDNSCDIKDPDWGGSPEERPCTSLKVARSIQGPTSCWPSVSRGLQMPKVPLSDRLAASSTLTPNSQFTEAILAIDRLAYIQTEWDNPLTSANAALNVV